MSYQIKVTPNYYQGTCGAPQEAYLTDRDLTDDYNEGRSDNIADFETREKAETWVDEARTGSYWCSHGEAGAPSYDIVEDFDDGEEDCLDAKGTAIGYQYHEVAPADLPRGVEGALDALCVDPQGYESDHDVYTASLDIDGVGYAIAYCPRTVALQINIDDLGNLNWMYPAYYVREED